MHSWHKPAIWPHLYINVTALSRAPSFLRLAPFSVASSSLPITELHKELRKASLGKNQRPLQPKLSKGNLKQTLSPSGDADTLISLSHLTEGASLAPRWRGALIRYQARAASEMMSDERRSLGHCLIWSKHWNTCVWGCFMTCLKNDFVHHGRPLMYEVLPRDFSTFPICTTFFFYTSLHKQWKYRWTTYIINAIYQGRNYMAKAVLILSCISNLVRNNFYQGYKKKMFSFYAIWFGLYRIYTFGVSYLFLMVVLHLRYMNVVFTSPLLGPRLPKALSNGVLRVSRTFCEQILFPPISSQ